MKLLDSAVVRRVRQSPRLRPAAVAAYRALERMQPARPGPRVVANSMPKSGTHLIAELLDQLPGMRFAGHLVLYNDLHLADPDPALAEVGKVLGRLRSSRFVGGHLIHDERIEAVVADSGVKLVTILRDPRAVAVSTAHYVLNATQLRGREEVLARFPDLESNLDASVYGAGDPGEEGHRPDIGVRFSQYAGWLDAQPGIVVRFEDLVGSAGGGSDERQFAEVSRMLDYLQVDLTGTSVEELAGRMFSEKVITFRAGTIDSWRKDLGPERERAVLDRCGETMTRLGYSV